MVLMAENALVLLGKSQAEIQERYSPEWIPRIVLSIKRMLVGSKIVVNKFKQRLADMHHEYSPGDELHYLRETILVAIRYIDSKIDTGAETKQTLLTMYSLLGGRTKNDQR